MQHHGSSAKRNIDFQFTYDEWIAWWGDDFDKRGTAEDDLVMARFNDVGPYHPDNVYKTTYRANRQEAADRKKKYILYKGNVYTATQLAEKLGIHGKTVRRKVLRGELEAQYV